MALLPLSLWLPRAAPKLASLRRALLALLAVSCGLLAAWLLAVKLMQARDAEALRWGRDAAAGAGAGAGADEASGGGGGEEGDAASPWTWACEPRAQRCEKRGRAPGQAHRPLLSCQMLCGEPPLWPRPTGNVSVGAASAAFHPDRIDFELLAPEEASPELHRLLALAAEHARGRLTSLLPPRLAARPRPAASAAAVPVRVRLSVLAPGPLPPRLSVSTDESYRLTVRAEGKAVTATVAGPSFFGVRHGLETLVQLAWWDGWSLRLLSNASLSDAPRFPYRGLMLDTSRNFYPLPALRTTIDAMAACKLNAFHWHLTDSHSFPYDSPAVPQMARYGAYSRERTYSAADVAALAEYARVRGVRLLPEVDAPAHAGNGWQWGEAEGLGRLSLCVNERYWPGACGQPPCGQLNPDNEHTYAVLGRLYAELFRLAAGSDLFHLGGDEVSFDCWRQHVANMSTQEDYLSKWLSFERRAYGELAAAAAAAQGGAHAQHSRHSQQPTAIVWSSPLTRALRLDPRRFAVQVWSPLAWADAQTLIAAKYRVILSHVDAWYLDCGLGDYRRLGDGACSPYRTWQHVYQHAPWRELGSAAAGSDTGAPPAAPAAPAGPPTAPPPARSFVLGGEACLWSERSDAQVLDSRLWPRAAALAERLWADPDPAPTDGSQAPLADGSNDATLLRAHQRISVQRERLVAWGVRADAVQPLWCHQNPELCF